MPREWPVEEFQDYLRACMRLAGIAGESELAELSGVSQNQLSTWRLGRNQPTMGNLRKIAHAMNVPPSKLFFAAGLVESHDFDTGPHGVDPIASMPTEFLEFVELYNGGALSTEQRSYARRLLAHLTEGLRAEVARSQVKPTGRRRPA